MYDSYVITGRVMRHYRNPNMGPFYYIKESVNSLVCQARDLMSIRIFPSPILTFLICGLNEVSVLYFT